MKPDDSRTPRGAAAVAVAVVSAAEEALTIAGRSLRKTLERVDERCIQADGINPREQLQNLYLCCKLGSGGSTGEMRCAVDNACTFLAAAFPIQVTEAKSAVTISYTVTWDDEPIFREVLLQFGDDHYLKAEPTSLMPLMTAWQTTMAQPHIAVSSLRGGGVRTIFASEIAPEICGGGRVFNFAVARASSRGLPQRPQNGMPRSAAWRIEKFGFVMALI